MKQKLDVIIFFGLKFCPKYGCLEFNFEKFQFDFYYKRISESNSSSENMHVLKISSTYGKEKGHFFNHKLFFE